MYIHCFSSGRRAWRNLPVSKKENKPVNKKNSQLVLRLNKDERDAFVDLCKDMDTSAAREIRRFIREFMKENGGR